MVEEYLSEAKKVQYSCTADGGCYWTGDKPVKSKGKVRCPVCGSDAVKEYLPTHKDLIKMRNKQIHKDIKKKYMNEAPIAAKGWTQKSIGKFEKTLGKKAKEHGFFDACVGRMTDKMGNQAKGFCASIKDAAYGGSGWRGKDKPKKDIKKDVKDTKFAKSKQLKKG